jgi:hypothetical protein
LVYNSTLYMLRHWRHCEVSHTDRAHYQSHSSHPYWLI